ncbi:MAG: hypothetical protein HY244_17975 [Rhizobiales bacterium]|nr:hypothetical protein [Hyphomicrobiales bacterium]
MKAMIVIATLLVFGATAQAKVSPLQSQAVVTASDVTAASQLAAAREADYFRAPQAAESTRIGEQFPPPCRLQHILFDKARLAQSCR